MKVALVHEFLTQFGGAERVLEVLHRIYPQAPVYTIFHDRVKTKGRYENWDVRESVLGRIPGARAHYKWYLPLMPWAVSSFDMKDYDVVISDSSAYAKWVRVGSGTHICYCHTPTRYLWQDRDTYVANLRYPAIVKIIVKPILSRFRRMDWEASQRVDIFIANSREVQNRIKRYYQRNSVVLYPPVDTDFFEVAPSTSNREYFLTGGRLEPSKHFELPILAANKLKIPLLVFGDGTESSELVRIAGPTVKILGRVTDEKLRSLYQHAQAFIYPALEDAGMSMVEAMSCGTPVLAYRRGGALEFVSEGLTGDFFDAQSVDSIVNAIAEFKDERFTSQSIRNFALKFGVNEYRSKFEAIVSRSIQERGAP